MKYNRLGSSDLVVSEVCMGTMTFVKQTNEEESFALMDACVDEGVNFFDTAENYPLMGGPEIIGASEEVLGRWLKTQQRDKIVIATKVVGRTGPNFTPGVYAVGNRVVPQIKELLESKLDRQNIHDACNASLRRLQVDCIDLYQAHWPDRYVPLWGEASYDPKKEYPTVPIEEMVKAFGELIEEGKIRHWGLSNETTFGVCKVVEACDKLGVPRPISIQNVYNLLCRTFDSELAEACAPSNFNIPLLSWSPLAGGGLSGKYLGGARPEKARITLMPRMMTRFVDPLGVQNATREYVRIAEEIGIEPAQLALAFCKTRWFMGSTIIGATSLEQLKTNLDAFKIELSSETLQAIDKVHRQFRNPGVH